MSEKRRVLLSLLLTLVLVMTACGLSDVVSDLDDQITTAVASQMTAEGPAETAAP